ncbi:MAG: hypothetical protein U0Q03_18020 [Acidimicrobiales bacterium]
MDHTADGPDRYELVLPGRARSLGPLRVFVAAVAADVGCSVDEIDDLRLGVSEALSLLVDVAVPPPVVRLTLEVERRVLRLTLTSEPATDGRTPDELALAVLSSVVDRHRVDRTMVELEKTARETFER